MQRIRTSRRLLGSALTSRPTWQRLSFSSSSRSRSRSRSSRSSRSSRPPPPSSSSSAAAAASTTTPSSSSSPSFFASLLGNVTPRNAIPYQIMDNNSVQFAPPEEEFALWRMRLRKASRWGTWVLGVYLFLYHDFDDGFDHTKRGEFNVFERFRFRIRRSMDEILGIPYERSSIVHEMRRRHPGVPLPGEEEEERFDFAKFRSSYLASSETPKEKQQQS